MADGLPADGRRDIVPRRLDMVPRLGRQLARTQTRHQSYTPTEAAQDWASFAAQRHVSAIGVDAEHGWIWMATWGGVLCWVPREGLCMRHTSAHGLVGNVTRSITVDRTGRVWAAIVVQKKKSRETREDGMPYPGAHDL